MDREENIYNKKTKTAGEKKRQLKKEGRGRRGPPAHPAPTRRLVGIFVVLRGGQHRIAAFSSPASRKGQARREARPRPKAKPPPPVASVPPLRSISFTPYLILDRPASSSERRGGGDVDI